MLLPTQVSKLEEELAIRRARDRAVVHEARYPEMWATWDFADTPLPRIKNIEQIGNHRRKWKGTN